MSEKDKDKDKNPAVETKDDVKDTSPKFVFKINVRVGKNKYLAGTEVPKQLLKDSAIKRWIVAKT